MKDLQKEQTAAGFIRNFIGLGADELRMALIDADKAGEPWPHPEWLKIASPVGMKGVQTGWEKWDAPAPAGAVVLRSEEEQRIWCGNRWFLFPH